MRSEYRYRIRDTVPFCFVMRVSLGLYLLHPPRSRRRTGVSRHGPFWFIMRVLRPLPPPPPRSQRRNRLYQTRSFYYHACLFRPYLSTLHAAEEQVCSDTVPFCDFSCAYLFRPYLLHTTMQQKNRCDQTRFPSDFSCVSLRPLPPPPSMQQKNRCDQTRLPSDFSCDLFRPLPPPPSMQQKNRCDQTRFSSDLSCVPL